jgi:prepilin-type N-terminal cleavage/methylation domain-containing protein
VIQRGFTLIELLVVIAIIGIIASIAIPQFAEYRVASYNASSLATLKNSVTAQEAVYVDTGSYISCISPFDCELKLPGLKIQNDSGTYMVNPIRHDAAPDGASYAAFAAHVNGTRTHRYTSSSGTFTFD